MARRLVKHRIVAIGLTVVGLTAAFMGGAYGTHVFDDVPSGAFYHNDVTWLSSRGVTAGCGGNNYCPNDAVTRGSMATFLHKFATRTRTGHFSCDEYAFIPRSSDTTFFHGTAALVSNDDMTCGVNIPDGATVTDMTSSFIDVDSTYEETCELQRQALTSPGTFTTMAFTTSGGTFSTGNVVTYDDSILNGVVNNGAFSYFVSCGPTSGSASVGVWAVFLTYSYLGTPAP